MGRGEDGGPISGCIESSARGVVLNCYLLLHGITYFSHSARFCLKICFIYNGRPARRYLPCPSVSGRLSGWTSLLLYICWFAWFARTLK